MHAAVFHDGAVFDSKMYTLKSTRYRSGTTQTISRFPIAHYDGVSLRVLGASIDSSSSSSSEFDLCADGGVQSM